MCNSVAREIFNYRSPSAISVFPGVPIRRVHVELRSYTYICRSVYVFECTLYIHNIGIYTPSPHDV